MKKGTKVMEKTGEGMPNMSRRAFLGVIAGAGASLMALLAGVPVIGAFLSPALKTKTGADWVDLGPLSSFEMAKPRMVPVTLVRQDGWVTESIQKSVWVVAKGEGEWVVFNSRCTHLGCAVNWREGAEGQSFYSPCHGGVFTSEGEVVAGPPPRPLDRLEYEVRGSNLYCWYQDFLVGVPEKVAI